MKAPARDPLDVYLFPAVVGGGLGDIEEVLLAGRRLARAGFRILLFRGPGRPLPRSVEGPWDWPRVERRDRLAPRADRALTVAPWWGVSAAPARPGPLGRAGPWAEECRSVEGTYGTGRVLQVSFEEFARTFTSRRQTAERLREGGVPVRTIRRGGGPSAAEIAEFRAAFTRFRAFDRPDVLHLYPTFSFSPAFRREFPESVQCGPFWPEPMARRPPRRGVWVWYASPGSSPQLARAMARNWPAGARRVRVLVRAPTPFPLPGADGLGFETLAPMAPAAWRDELARAELRIVTGSRTLLEALVLGAPFLYYNGVTGRARGARRHRPEKIEGLLALWRRQGVAPRLRRDLANFARGRDLAGVLARARDDPGWRREFPRRPSVGPFPPGYGDAGGLLEALARAWSRSTGSSEELVARLRRYEPIAPAERGARSPPPRRRPTGAGRGSPPHPRVM